MKIELTTQQMAFVESTAFETLYGGAAGGGKSYGQLVDALLFAAKYAGSMQLVLRRTFPELERSLIRESRLMYPKEACTYNESKKMWTFRNGSTIEFGYLDRDADVTQYQSAQYNIIRFDELTHFTEFMYTYMISRVRAANPYPKQLKCSTNPGSVGHAWVKARFVDHYPAGNVLIPDPSGKGNDRIYIPAKVQDNLFLMDTDPNYVSRLEMLGEETRKALLDGDWNVFKGQYFKEWRYDKHVCEPFAIPSYWYRFCSMDWGYNDPCAVLWYAVNPEGRIYVYRETYERERKASEVALDNVRLSKAEGIHYCATSPDAWNKTGGDDLHGECKAETMISLGWPVLRADNDRKNGWDRVREYLADAADGIPMLQIFSTCSNLIRTLPGLVYDDKRVEDVSDECEDHAPESLRYGLMSRPRKASMPAKELYPINTIERRVQDKLASLTKPKQGGGLKQV